MMLLDPSPDVSVRDCEEPECDVSLPKALMIRLESGEWRCRAHFRPTTADVYAALRALLVQEPHHARAFAMVCDRAQMRVPDTVSATVAWICDALQWDAPETLEVGS